MIYRCPYCKQEFGTQPLAHCPGCGKVMRVPVRQPPEKRRAKIRALNRIEREYAQKRAELQAPVPPTLFRNPKFYLGVMVLLALIGASLFNATDRVAERMKEAPYLKALRHLDVLAEALGRYRFHTGAFPDAEQGLAALVRDPHVPKWDGPYINLLRKDPWETPFVYAPSTNGLPALFSCGPDKAPGTPDDLRPDPARYEPGTEWTNGWVSAEQRLPGVSVLPAAQDRRAE